MIDCSDVEALIEECFNETSAASRKKYDAEQADRTAALFLTAQMKLSFLIEEVEMKARNSKNEISRVEGEKYFEYKTSSDKKITENTLTSFVAKDKDVMNSKLEHSKYESIMKKWNHVLSVLKDGHIYFRNLGKNKTWAE